MKNTIFHKIILLGDSAVGKTSIVTRYIFNSCNPDHQATIGIDFFSKVITENDTTIRLQIWDTAGQEKFHSLIPSYIRNTTVALLIYDITNRATFENLQKWHTAILNTANPHLFVVGNKVDLEDLRQITIEEGKMFANEIGADFIETSARGPTNILELFTRVSQLPPPIEDTISSDSSPTDNSNLVITVNVADINNKNDQQSGCYC